MGEIIGGGLEEELLVGEDGGETLEEGAALGSLGVEPVDGLDLEEAVVLLVVARGADLAGDVIAGAEGEAAQVGLRDVDVVRSGEEGFAAEEAVVTVVGDLEEAAGEEVAAAFGLGLEEAEDEIALAQGGGVADAELAGEADQLAARGAFQLGDIERGDAILAVGGGGGGFFSRRRLRCTCNGNDPVARCEERSARTGEMGCEKPRLLRSPGERIGRLPGF